MDNEQAYLTKINVLCRLPYAEREQKHRGLFALADELEALPSCDGRNRLLGRIYAELADYETAVAYFSAVADKNRKDIKNLLAQQEAAKRFGSSHAVARSAAKRQIQAVRDAAEEKLAAAVTAAAELWYGDKH